MNALVQVFFEPHAFAEFVSSRLFVCDEFRRVLSHMHSSFLRRIWLNFMAQYGFSFDSLHFSPFFFSTSNFFGPSTTDETSLVEMRIWCIQIGIVHVLTLHFNPWVEASAGGLLVPEGLYSPVAKYFGICLKIRI